MLRLTPDVISDRLATGQYVLGKLCDRQHGWGETRQSVRVPNGCCVRCKVEKDRERYDARNPEKHRQQSAIRTARYRVKLKSEGGDRLEEFNRKNRENVERWRVECNDTYRESLRKYRSSEKGKLTDKRKANKRRAAKKDAHCAPYSKRDLRNRLVYFGHKCVYCSTTITTAKTYSWDHFIPLCRGGPDALGNLVLACIECNSSKKHRDPEVWYFTQSFATKRKWSALLKKLGTNNAGQMALL